MLKNKTIFIISIILLLQNIANAKIIDYNNYHDTAVLYTSSSFPETISKRGDIPNIENLKNLKRGESKVRNFLNFVEIGNSSIHKAAKNGNITKIYYVDRKIDKVYVPLFFIPFYLKEKKTIVYGE